MFRPHDGAIRSAQIIEFLKALCAQLKRKLLIVWDGGGHEAASFQVKGLAKAYQVLYEVPDAVTKRQGLRVPLLRTFGEIRLTALLLAASAGLHLRLFR